MACSVSHLCLALHSFGICPVMDIHTYLLTVSNPSCRMEIIHRWGGNICRSFLRQSAIIARARERSTKIAMFHQTFAHALYAGDMEASECQPITEDALLVEEAAENTITWIHWVVSASADAAKDLAGCPHRALLDNEARILKSVKRKCSA